MPGADQAEDERRSARTRRDGRARVEPRSRGGTRGAAPTSRVASRCVAAGPVSTAIAEIDAGADRERGDLVPVVGLPAHQPARDASG